MIGVIGLFLSLLLFIFMSFKGWNIAVSATLASVLLVFTNHMNLADSLSVTFASGFGGFASSWWLMFALGALFGKAMQETGMSSALARLLSERLHGNAMMMILLISLIMSYGGIGTFVIAFTIYPIASELFQKEGISTVLLPAAMLFCPTTLSMTMLPGTPSVQNILPTKYLDTDIYAAPVLGVIASIITFLLGSAYLFHAAKKYTTESKESSSDPLQKSDSKDWLSLLPCICLWIMPFLLVRFGLDSQLSVEIAMIAGIIICLAAGRKKYNIRQVINQGFVNGLETLAMTSCIMGYGSLVKATPAFSMITDHLFGASSNPLLSSILAVNLIAAITGSSTSGLQLFFDSFSEQLTAIPLSSAQFHRIIAIASGGLDSMPYATGVAVANDLSKTKLSKTYLHIFITCAVIPLIALAVVLLAMSFTE